MAHDHRSFALPIPLKDSAAPKRRSESRAAGMLFPYLREFRVRVVIALAFLTAAKLAHASGPLILKEVVDSLDAQPHVLFSIVPVILEFSLVAVILLTQFDWRFAAVTFVAVALYIGFSVSITEWRMEIRRRANELDSKANTRAIDSLLNYETVKYFNN